MALKTMATMATPPSKSAGKPDYECNDNILKPRVKITNNINEKICFLQERERGAQRPFITARVMGSSGLFCQPTPIAMHWPIVQVMPY